MEAVSTAIYMYIYICIYIYMCSVKCFPPIDAPEHVGSKYI